MTVKTTRKTSDPYIIMKARDLIKLLARSIPCNQAVKILNDDFYSDIVKISGLVGNKERFVKRRQRLIGPDGSTLKALELLTGCYILVQGNTVSLMGGHKGLKDARNVVIDCMKNIHPVYNIKRLMIMKELAKDEKLKNEDWSRFLPDFKKKNVQRKKPKQKQNKGLGKKTYTPFPPPQTPSKIDKMLDSGEYFMSERSQEAKKRAEKIIKGQRKTKEKREQREKDFQAPVPLKKKTEKSNSKDSFDVKKLKNTFEKEASKRKSRDSDGVSAGKKSEHKHKSKKKKRA